MNAINLYCSLKFPLYRMPTRPYARYFRSRAALCLYAFAMPTRTKAIMEAIMKPIHLSPSIWTSDRQPFPATVCRLRALPR